MSKTISMPLEEYDNELNKKLEWGRQLERSQLIDRICSFLMNGTCLNELDSYHPDVKEIFNKARKLILDSKKEK